MKRVKVVKAKFFGRSGYAVNVDGKNEFWEETKHAAENNASTIRRIIRVKKK